MWRTAILLYRLMHEYAENTTVAKIKKLEKLLDGEADKLYRVADRLERDPQTAIEANPIDGIRTRLIKHGYADDPIVRKSIVSVIKQAPVRTPPTPVDLRRLAARLLEAGKNRCGAFNTCLKESKKLRAQSGRGRYPSAAMDYLLNFASVMYINDAELARRMAAEGIEPEDRGSDEPDLAIRWAAIIKTARARQRRRGQAVTK